MPRIQCHEDADAKKEWLPIHMISRILPIHGSSHPPQIGTPEEREGRSDPSELVLGTHVSSVALTVKATVPAMARDHGQLVSEPHTKTRSMPAYRTTVLEEAPTRLSAEIDPRKLARTGHPTTLLVGGILEKRKFSKTSMLFSRPGGPGKYATPAPNKTTTPARTTNQASQALPR